VNILTVFTSLSLCEVLLIWYSMEGPSTFWRNQSRSPIDGAWASIELNITAGGYFAYDEVFLSTEHRCL